jgi:hypothetical protein
VLSLDGRSWVLWDVTIGRPVRIGVFPTLPPGPLVAGLSADGRTLVVVGSDRTLAAFDLVSGRQVWSAVAPAAPVRLVATSDGRGVPTVGADGSVRRGVLHGGCRAKRCWPRLVGVLVGVGVGLGTAIGWLPPWFLAVVPLVAGVPPGRQVRFTLSWGERGTSRG